MAAIPALFGLLMAALVSGQVDISPREAVRRVGQQMNVTCKVAYAIDSCRMRVGQTSYRLLPNNQVGDIVYAGGGLAVGECGVLIKNVQEDMNGEISCTLPPQSGSIELIASMRLIVARAPDAPQLLSLQQQYFTEGDQFEAQCVVAHGRPAAKITWFLDEEPLVAGTHQPVIEQEPGADLATVRQNVTRSLRAADAGRRLRCRADHPALDAPRDASRQLTVHYPPRRTDGETGPITIFGLALGAEGRLNVSVRASPPPRAEWTLGDQRLVAPQQADDGMLTALNPIPLGFGEYNITLVLARVSKEDVERTYYLRVSNDLGREEIAVRISTMDEPAGVELDTGAIVGIVVAVLVLLVAVSLLVFAKATDRWCFAGRSHRTDIPDGGDSEAPLPPHDDVKGSENPSHDHGDYISNGGSRGRDHAKSSGESSDTESAVGGRAGGRGVRARLDARLDALGARVRAALPRRARDKVQDTEAHAAETEEKLSEEKKGVVYAELALGAQPEGRAPPPAAPAPPAAEYAEIVYTDHQKEAKE